MIINDISTILVALIQLAKMVVLLRLEEITKCPFVLVMLAAIDRWCLHRHIQMNEAFVEIITVVAISIIQVVLLLIQTAGEHCNLIPMYGSRIQQQSQALSSSRPTGEMFGNGVFTQPSLGSGNNTALVSGYNSQHTPQQFGSGSSGYYQQGSVSDWGGQMDVSGGTNERNAAATRSFLGGGSNVGSSSTQWNSGGDWGGTLGANTIGLERQADTTRLTANLRVVVILLEEDVIKRNKEVFKYVKK
uniref:Uncharacterized protein n=1 Tax=Meloidogyne enterolobii TaxID=390850 RepID=A0A6V7Y0H5_MELEN|nr:unnamed protein product [Meloidogyne enterolobii]